MELADEIIHQANAAVRYMESADNELADGAKKFKELKDEMFKFRLRHSIALDNLSVYQKKVTIALKILKGERHNGVV